MYTLLQLAITPVLIIIFYIYLKDKYEPEPLELVIKIILAGIIITIPTTITEHLLIKLTPNFIHGSLGKNLYFTFIVAGLTEEGFKFSVLYFFILKNKEFDEHYDGIVYAVAVSLGFALVENILYVMDNGYSVAISRAFISIPGHTVFAIIMGYFLAIYKFRGNKKITLLPALIIPVLMHGFFDFLLFQNLMRLFIIFFILSVFLAYRIIKIYTAKSKKQHAKNL